MRTCHYKPEAQENLGDLRALPDVNLIHQVLEDLAAGRKQGYAIPLQSPFLSPQRILYRYQVGRYKLNYTLTVNELILQSVML